MAYKAIDPLVRFPTKVRVKKGGCWLWLPSIRVDSSGKSYGYFGIGYEVLLAHRVSYTLYVGNIPKGICVCHTCDTPSYVNPEHLFLGTHKDNVKDILRKGRGACRLGESNASAILTEKKVIEARAMREQGYSLTRIAAYLGVGKGTASAALTKRTWRHI